MAGLLGGEPPDGFGLAAATATFASRTAAASTSPTRTETRWLLRRRYMAILRTLAAPEAAYDDDLYRAAVRQLHDSAIGVLSALTGARASRAERRHVAERRRAARARRCTMATCAHRLAPLLHL